MNQIKDSIGQTSDAIENEAARWLIRRESDRFTPARQARFQAWLEERIAHRIAFIRLDAAWRKADRLRALGAGVPKGVIPPRGFWGNPHLVGQRSPAIRNPAACADDPDSSERPEPHATRRRDDRGQLTCGVRRSWLLLLRRRFQNSETPSSD